MIDLHIHSTASDGSFPPLEILRMAREQGIEAISLTDHDTIEGVRDILSHIQPSSVEFITGVEISCDPPPAFSHLGSIHLLGYGFSPYDRQLHHLLVQAQESRKQRNPKIINRLKRMGIDISLEQVQERFGGRMGRPHIAEYLKDTGVVDTFEQAFDKYLGKGRPAHVEKFKVSCQKAVKIILDAGGVPVLAHPGLLDFSSPGQMENFVNTLVSFGLQGIEVYHTDNDETVRLLLKKIAGKHKLLITGGSDFHGDFTPEVKLGRGKDNIQVEFSVFRALAGRVAAIRRLHTRLDILEENLGHHFADRALLENALCHRSYLNEHQKSCLSDNERLEFLGDAVLGLCVGHILMAESPSRKEGQLSRIRSSLVSEPALADMARSVDLGRFVKLGKGEAVSGGAQKNSILSDTFEAVIAAVYLDAGFDKAFELVSDLFGPCIRKKLSGVDVVDYKSALQEYAQEVWSCVPLYRLIGESGPDHEKIFQVSLEIDHISTTGTGKTKKAAEQDAAQKALVIIKG